MRKPGLIKLGWQLFALLTLSILVASASGKDSIMGYWVVPGRDAVLQISQDGEFARIEIKRSIDSSLTDNHNPDRQKRNQAIDGLMLGKNFKRDGPTWTGGSLYDPASGKTYRAKLRLLDANHLHVRGYIGTPLLGRSQTWTRLIIFKEQMQRLLDVPSYDTQKDNLTGAIL